MSHPRLLTRYTTRDVAGLLGLTTVQVRRLAGAGFLHPARGGRGELLFSFQDLVLLKAANALREADISPRRVSEALRRLATQLPRGRSLSAVRITAEGNRIVAREGDRAWQPESGQGILDFEVADLAELTAPFAARALASAEAEQLSAEDWFQLGWELEASSPERAEAAYRRAADLDTGHGEARLNLGRLLHEAGKPADAEGWYRAARECRPQDADAAFNLGVALEDLGRLAEAAEVYEDAVALDDRHADALFNLAGIFEKLGHKAKAVNALSRYRRLLQDG